MSKPFYNLNISSLMIIFWFNRESGSARDATKQNSPETGVVVQRGMPDFFEYNSTDVQLTYQLGTVELSLEKMHNVWGYGQRSTGTVIFSEKSPSYPQIKLRLRIDLAINQVAAVARPIIHEMLEL